MQIKKDLSPNFTPEDQSTFYYGVVRSFDYTVLHWWGDPNDKPTLEGTVNYLKNPQNKVSAHFVVSDDTIVQLVELDDIAWHARDANPISIGIEIDPQFPGKTYETVAWLVKYVSEKTGIPINTERVVGHRKFVATTCPGTLDIPKVIALANGSVVSEMIDPTKDLPTFYEDKFELKDKDWYNKYWTLDEMMEFLLDIAENYEEPDPNNPKLALSDDIPTLIEEMYNLKDHVWYNKHWTLEEFIKYATSLGDGEKDYIAFLHKMNEKIKGELNRERFTIKEEQVELEFGIDSLMQEVDNNITKDISVFEDKEIKDEFFKRLFASIFRTVGIDSEA